MAPLWGLPSCCFYVNRTLCKVNHMAGKQLCYIVSGAVPDLSPRLPLY